MSISFILSLFLSLDWTGLFEEAWFGRSYASGVFDQTLPQGCISRQSLETIKKRLRREIKSNLDRTTPHATDDFQRVVGMSPPFHGHFDVHSSIHAHWVLLRSESESRGYLYERLSKENLELIRYELTRRHNLYRIYDKVWLLLLLGDLLDASDYLDREFVLGFYQEIEKQVEAWLTHPVLVPVFGADEVLEYSSVYSRGDHLSWGMAYFLYRISCGLSCDSRLQEIYKKQAREEMREYGLTPSNSWDFVDLYSLIQMLDRQGERRNSESFLDDDLSIDILTDFETLTLSNAHGVGREVMKLWPLARGAKRDQEICLKYYSNLQDFMSSKQLWKRDFELLSHWIPQFLMISVLIYEGMVSIY